MFDMNLPSMLIIIYEAASRFYYVITVMIKLIIKRI